MKGSTTIWQADEQSGRGTTARLRVDLHIGDADKPENIMKVIRDACEIARNVQESIKLIFGENKTLKNRKGISPLIVIVLVALLIVFVAVWIKYFSKPLTTVVTGGIERAEPAKDRARQAGDALEKLNRNTDETAKKLNEETGQ